MEIAKKTKRDKSKRKKVELNAEKVKVFKKELAMAHMKELQKKQFENFK